MIYENPIIFKKLLRSDSKEKFYWKNINKSIILRLEMILSVVFYERKNII